jgi:hypothetical protein
MLIGEKIADDIKKNSKITEMVRDLEKNPIENTLSIYDWEHENPEKMDVYFNNVKNYLILWKGLNPPTASIVAESNREVKELLRKIEGIECSFLVKSQFAKPIERKYRNMKKENWTMFSIDKENFTPIINHKVEFLEPKPEYVKQINQNWLYSTKEDDYKFILENMQKYPSCGIRRGDELLSHFIIVAETDKSSFLAGAYTKEEFRNKGMQTSTTSVLTQNILERGKTPCMYIVEGNVPSIKAVSKVGYRPFTTHVRFDPK